MKYAVKNQIRTGVIGFLVIMMLFGCASGSNINLSQKYEDSKSWFKEKWNAMGSKFSSSGEEASAIKRHPKKPNYLVYQTQWSYETLSGIAAWFTGDSKNWKALAKANPKIRPNLITEGELILIPAKLAKVKTIPTEAFAAKHRINYFEHKVRWQGETLSLIAKWYTGHYGNWKALAKANPGLNPNRIASGDIILIPPKIMKTKKRLPHRVVAKPVPAGGYFKHIVRRPDETLSQIAKWYTGKADNAKQIAKVNPDIDTEFLLVGNEINIPSNLLKTRTPMNQKAIQISASEPPKKSPASKPAAPAPKKKKMQLFGPKQFPAN